MQEVEGSTPTGGTCAIDFSDPIDRDIRIQCALSIRVAVGESSVTERRWRPPYQACARKTQRGRTHGARCSRPWFRTAEPLGERRYENWITHWSDYDKPFAHQVILVC